MERVFTFFERCSSVMFAGSVSAIALVFRLPVFFTRSLNTDEVYYAVGATRLLAGGLFYRDVVDHKPPGIYWIYAALFRLSGQIDLAFVHVALIIVVAGTALLIAVIGERLIDRRSGRVAGLLYVVASGVGPPGDFLAANGELFMNLPAVAAMALYLSPCTNPEQRWRSMVRLTLVGLLTAGAALVKLQAAAILLPIVLHLISAGGPRLRPLFTLAVAVSAPFIALIIGYHAAGALGDLLWAVRYGAVTYVNALTLSQKLAKGFLNSILLAAMLLPLLAAAVSFGTRAARWRGAGRLCVAVLTSWLVGGFVAVSAGGRFYPHYYLQLIPPLVLMAAGCFGERRREA